jgi:hypothetical protein
MLNGAAVSPEDAVTGLYLLQQSTGTMFPAGPSDSQSNDFQGIVADVRKLSFPNGMTEWADVAVDSSGNTFWETIPVDVAP